ncbi:hypothetical protein M501DRAFT_1026770 [Patellaria atrata CBS 101060]|uniref:GCS light chain n=1 Tax=Patellaria atrata CBS 101060 TaxID=1346257 RepID=A0A9P4VJN1_9PEZI|nr:hypothetical protein M501DRAFT_1026770 [Patellaria atrata CBS 101060]
MKLILSTGNIIGSKPSIARRPLIEKSNTELTTSLRAHFASCQSLAATHSASQSSTAPTNSPSSSSPSQPPSYEAWTQPLPPSSSSNENTQKTLLIPSPKLAPPTPLAEDRAAYDITIKLFYLPSVRVEKRAAQTREALRTVCAALGVSSVDLCIVSFPGVAFDAEDEDSVPPSPSSDPTQNQNSDPTDDPTTDGDAEEGETDTPDESLESMIATWHTLETLYSTGAIRKLGVAEFNTSLLSRFLAATAVGPAVDQINVRDCCVVPKPLILFAKEKGVELLTHNDCTDILPRGTVRELLGAAGVLVRDGDKGKGLRGEVEPQWVVKYTAVVKDRGVVESKGYFAVAELEEEG